MLSYPHFLRFVARLFIGCLCFHLRSSIGLAVSLAIKWLAAHPFSARGLSCQRSSYCKSSHWRLSYCKSGLLELESSGVSHRRCDVNKRHENRFGGKKNNRLMIGKKPSNPARTEEENRSRKVLLVVQLFKINLLSQ